MTLVSITAVGAFDAVGSILVVALMIAPPSAAYLLTDRLSRMISISAGVGVTSAISGYWLAHILDASIAGSMATMTGVIFFLTYLLAPGRGLISLMRMRSRQKWDFAVVMLTVHLCHHEGKPGEAHEQELVHIHEFLKWEPAFADRVVQLAQRRNLIMREDDSLSLTDRGRDTAQEAMAQ